MRKLSFLLVALLLFSPLSAKPTTNDVIVATAAVADATLAVVGGFAATPSYAMPGCTIVLADKGDLPSSLTFEKSDLGLYGELIPPAGDDPSWYAQMMESLHGPLDALLRTTFSVHDWKKGEALLDGTVVPSFPSGMSFSSLFASCLAGKTMSIPVSVDVVVRGRRVSVPVRVTGTFSISGVGTRFSIVPDEVSTVQVE